MTIRGYIGQVAEVRPILEAMESRGLPIDDAARIALGEEFRIAQEELGREIAALAPEECKRVHPKGKGYVGIPPEVRKWMVEISACLPANHGELTNEDLEQLSQTIYVENGDDGERYRYAQREFNMPRAADDGQQLFDIKGEPLFGYVSRWCRVYDFNPNSSQQLIQYMKVRKHPVPKGKMEDDDGNAKDTTAKKELQRLAHKTGDSFYLKVIEYRELGKMRGTYIDGFRPGSDGRVHSTFTFDTGTGQLTSRNPNIQNFPKHGRLAKPVRTMVSVPEGKVIVEVDYKSYHVLTTGYCAEDSSWMRMARLDMHTFVAGCFLNTWSPSVMEESDDSLRDRFRWFKSDNNRKRVRDTQAKPTILGVGFGMGTRRLYQENLEHFPDEKTAKRFHSMLQVVFPKIFKWQAAIRKKAHDQQYLVSPFGHMRRFYEVFRWDSTKSDWTPGDQAEEAVAFLPANIAFGNIRETMKEQARLGLDERFGLCNTIHDSFLYVFPRPLLDEFVATVIPVLTAPSKVLIHPVLAPDGLQVDVEASVGQNWSEMHELTLPKLSIGPILAPQGAA